MSVTPIKKIQVPEPAVYENALPFENKIGRAHV